MSNETEMQKAERLKRECELLNEARAEFAAGQVIDEQEFDHWLDKIDSDEDVPPPKPTTR